ncbi:MAG TPA: M28 family peptidase [Pyrinomonadaceae bacterium]|nr:M28 family peptidase [Pyrinomonadaceae bacterium]
MKKLDLRVLFLTIALTAVGIAAQTAQPQKETAGIRKTIEYLASDKLEGRRTGSKGANLAGEYVEAQFKAAGLKPGVGGKSYKQEFPYVTHVEIGPANAFSAARSAANIKLASADISPVGFSPNGTITDAQLVFVGFGITAKDQKYDDYARDGAPLDVRGKVVIAFDGNQANDDPHSPFRRFDLRTKASIAKENGAVGLIVISREKNFADERLRKLTFDQTLGTSVVPTFIVSRKGAGDLFGLDASGLDKIEADTIKGEQWLNDPKDTVHFRVELVQKTVPAYNIIGVLPGIDPKLKDEVIVIGAHYDHLGRGGSGSLAPNSTEIHHGADDNASGTAAIIEIARNFARAKNNARTLLFISFSGEEEGLFGSNWYVNHPTLPIAQTVAMINLDMVGRLNEGKLTIGGMGTASEWKALVEKHSNDTSGKPIFHLQLSDDGFGPSDHSSFYGKKIPVLFFFTGTHADYHKPSDTAEKINYDGEYEIVRFVERIVNALDATATRPTYEVAKSAPAARTAFNVSLGTVPNYAETSDGLHLDAVRDDSPAAKAGVKGGDIVIKLAGKEVRNISDYMFALGEMKAGETYEIVVRRGNETLTLKIVPVHAGAR